MMKGLRSAVNGWRVTNDDLRMSNDDFRMTNGWRAAVFFCRLPPSDEIYLKSVKIIRF